MKQSEFNRLKKRVERLYAWGEMPRLDKDTYTRIYERGISLLSLMNRRLAND